MEKVKWKKIGIIEPTARATKDLDLPSMQLDRIAKEVIERKSHTSQ